MFLGFENLNFVKQDIGYHVAKFQISWLSGSNFMEVSVRPQKHHYDVIMMSFTSTLVTQEMKAKMNFRFLEVCWFYTGKFSVGKTPTQN